MTAWLETSLIGALSIASTFAAGLGAKPGAARSAARPLVRALAWNLLVVPLTTAALLRVLHVDATVALGLLLAASAPGGSTGPLLVQLARGEMAVGVLLFVALALVTTIATPLLLVLLSAEGLALLRDGGFATVLLGMLAAQLAPLLVGLSVRRVRPRAAERLGPIVGKIGLGLLLVVVVGLLVTRGQSLEATKGTAMVAAGLSVVASLAVVLVVRTEPRRVRAAIAQVSAVRNLSLALLVASLLGASAVTSLAILVYGLVMYVVAGTVAVVQRARAGGAGA